MRNETIMTKNGPARVCSGCGEDKLLEVGYHKKTHLCKDCKSKRFKVWYQRHRDSVLDRNRRWLANNRERRNAWQRDRAHNGTRIQQAVLAKLLSEV